MRRQSSSAIFHVRHSLCDHSLDLGSRGDQIGNNTANLGDGTISFPSSAPPTFPHRDLGPISDQYWTKLDLPANYTTARGAATHLITNGNSITFVDQFGSTSPAVWINASQLSAFGLTVTVGNGTLDGV